MGLLPVQFLGHIAYMRSFGGRISAPANTKNGQAAAANQVSFSPKV